MSASAFTPAPCGITLDAHTLTLQWDAAQTTVLQAGFLRTHCHCSQCRQASLRGGRCAPDLLVSLVDASPVGSYGLQLHFSDGHDRGIYPWAYLRELAQTAMADAMLEAV